MSGYIDDLRDELEGAGEHQRGFLTVILRILQQMNEWRHTISARVSGLEDQSVDMLRLDFVATVADLPANAAARQWYRVTTGTVAERAAIYVGNGQNQPLTKITPTVL